MAVIHPVCLSVCIYQPELNKVCEWLEIKLLYLSVHVNICVFVRTVCVSCFVLCVHVYLCVEKNQTIKGCSAGVMF